MLPAEPPRPTATDIDATVGGIRLTFRHSPAAEVWLTSVSTAGFRRFTAQSLPADSQSPLVELGLAGEGRTRHSHHARHRHYSATHRLRYYSHELRTDERDGTARLDVVQNDPLTGVTVVTTFTETSAHTVDVRNRLLNEGGRDIVVEYLSTLILGGFSEVIGAPVLGRLRVSTARNTWGAEYRWQTEGLPELGFIDGGVGPGTSNLRVTSEIGGAGGWSTAANLPVAVVEDAVSGTTWAWQVEHNGAWHTEFSDVGTDLSVSISGPTNRQHHWRTRLAPGAEFTSVPVGLAVVDGDLTAAIGALTAHRRAIRRPHPDHSTLPVIFNDYMNCLMGDPSTEKLLPLVNAAARAGAGYFVVDAGWYADDGGWWPTVGVWRESAKRFPRGLTEVFDAVRDAGMVPGLWLEPEVMGIQSPAVFDLPPEAFFRRSGEAIAEHSRYHLDFRHPAVVARLDEVVDRLVADYGVGYLKLDHNINIGEGTEVGAESVGDGLLGHNRAYTAWLAAVLERHPSLVLENCSSGGMRTDYAQLAVSQLQSTSDQENPLYNVTIAAASTTAVTPEQSAVWSYPQPEHSDDLIDLTLAQSLLHRVHLSGRIDLLSDDQLDRVRRILSLHRELGPFIRGAEPFWPLGLPGWTDEWVAAGLRNGDRRVVVIWRRPIPGVFRPDAPPAALGGWALTTDSSGDRLLLPGIPSTARLLLPTDRGVSFEAVGDGIGLTVPALPGTAVLEWFE